MEQTQTLDSYGDGIGEWSQYDWDSFDAFLTAPKTKGTIDDMNIDMYVLKT